MAKISNEDFKKIKKFQKKYYAKISKAYNYELRLHKYLLKIKDDKAIVIFKKLCIATNEKIKLLETHLEKPYNKVNDIL